MRKFTLKCIDFFYPIFARFLSLHTFRYLVFGSANALFGVFVYFIAYNYILKKQDITVFSIYITAPVAAFIIEFCIILPIGFISNKYLVFTQSSLRGRVQLFRYSSVAVTNILLNYALMKFLVETLLLFPTVSKFITTVIIAGLSYLFQKHFSFRIKKQRK